MMEARIGGAHDYKKLEACAMAQLSRRSFGISAFVAPFAMAATPISYQVPGSFPVLKQEGNTCWAEVAAMMYNWRHATALPTKEVLEVAGSQYVSIFSNKKDLSADLKPGLLSALGIVAEAPQNYAPSGWLWLLQEFGLQWVTTAVASIEPFSTHARLVRGINIVDETDGEKVFLSVVDPLGGKQYEQTLTKVSKYFDMLAYAENTNRSSEELVPQVFHFRKPAPPRR